MTPASSDYSDRFYATHGSTVRASADVVVELLRDLGVLPAERVLDIGCGRGDWLSAFGAAGSSYLVGADGAWNVEAYRDHETIDFRAVDLESLSVDQVMQREAEEFDLAMSLEVAEHLTPIAGDALVGTLVHAAPIVLFSAAVPGQGGTEHRNEQWPSYWSARFAEHGYLAYDVLRPSLWADARVGYWYRQNLILYASLGAVDGVISCPAGPPLDLVHPELLVERRRIPLAADWLGGSARVARQTLARTMRRNARR